MGTLNLYSVIAKQNMLQEICIKTSEITLSVLSSQTEIKDNSVCNPIEYFTTIYRLQSGVLGITSGNDLNSGHLFNQNLKKYSVEENEALGLFKSWFSNQNFEKVNLSDLYELMLLLEFPIQDGKITTDAENLNSIGSFYTPHNLTDKIVELALDGFIHRNLAIEHFSSIEKTESVVEQVTELFAKSSYADYSCGTGNFLLAILRYCKSNLHISIENLKTIALNFNAVGSRFFIA